MDIESNATAKPAFREIEHGGYRYQVYPVTGRAAGHLDRKVTTFSVALAGRKYSDRAQFVIALMQTFSTISDDEFDELVSQTLYNVVRVAKDANDKSVRVTIDNVYDLFAGDLDGLYGLLIACWEAYGLTPFAKKKASGTGG